MPLSFRPFLTLEICRQGPFDVPRVTELKDAHAQRPGASVVMPVIGELIPSDGETDKLSHSAVEE